jgi:hypothetical protein
MKQALSDELEGLERAWNGSAAGIRVLGSLRPKASAKDLAALRTVIERGVPDDLAELYAWHDGQKPDARLSTKTAYRWLPLREVKTAYRFLRDPKQDFACPTRPEWIPFLHSARGDYVVYDARSGVLLEWVHDERKPVPFAKSLRLYLRQLEAAAKREPKKPVASGLAAPPRAKDVELEVLETCPSIAELSKAAPGSFFLITRNGAWFSDIYVSLGGKKFVTFSHSSATTREKSLKTLLSAWSAAARDPESIERYCFRDVAAVHKQFSWSIEQLKTECLRG